MIEAPISGPIDPVTVQFVKGVLATADKEHADVVLFTLDTPGGLSTSMDSIVRLFVDDTQKIPVVVYVSPRGAEAASAGLFLTLAGDLAAMAPGTNIGSATPIQGNGKNIDKDLRKKILNNAEARIRNIARDHKRDEKFPVAAIRSAENITSDEALKRNVIDVVAKNERELLMLIDGRTTHPKGLKINSTNARVKHLEVPWHQKILKQLIDPNIIFFLFSAGLLGLAFEITHPGVVLPGVVGAICFVIALYGFQVLPTTTAGLVLLFAGVIMFAAEAVVVSHGVLAIGGTISFAIGGLMLFQSDSGLAVNRALLFGTTLLLAGFFGVIVVKAFQARRKPVTTGSESMIGARGIVRRAIDPKGSVFVNGELWGAHAATPIAEDTEVVVTQLSGLTLTVQPVDEGVASE